jgi:hypothetical protein
VEVGGVSVDVGYDPESGLVKVRDSKHPKASPIEWSPEMWESSVWSRIVQGQLPAGALEEGVDPEPFSIAVPQWTGSGAVIWGGHRFEPAEWQRFVDAVRLGDMSVEVLTGG